MIAGCRIGDDGSELELWCGDGGGCRKEIERVQREEDGRKEKEKKEEGKKKKKGEKMEMQS